MNKTVVVWLVILAFLTLKSFRRPSYAIGVYMLTFFAHPQYWWWGNILEGFRWNLLSGVLLIGTLVLSGSDTKSTGRGPLSTSAVPIVFLMALNAALVHIFLAANPDSSIGWLTARLKFILLFFLMQFSIRDRKDYRVVAMSIAMGMAYVGYEATINERGSFSGGRLEGIGAAGVTSSNQLASLLITGLPLATTLLFTEASRWVKALTVVCCALTFNVVLMCNSRGAFLGVLCGAAVFLLMASGPARRQSKRLLALGLIGTFFLLGDPEILNRFMTTFTGEAQRDASAQSRIFFWTSASGMLRDYPFGSGGNSFSEGRGWRYVPRVKAEATDVRAIHNGFLTEATDWGVQGFLIMMLFLLTVWRTSWRGRRLALASGDAKAILAFGCMAASLVAWMVSSIFGDYLNDEWGFWTAAMTFAFFRVQMLAPATEDLPEADPDQVVAHPYGHAPAPGFAR